MKSMDVKPFIKWAGGKRQLIGEISERLPQSYGRYFEPFLGGGAVLFSLVPESATVNDINPALINTYQQIRDDVSTVMNLLGEYDSGLANSDDAKAYYYEMRDRYNGKLRAGLPDAESAALLIFLNKHCFNGLYRVNKAGLFNVPYNNSVAASFDEKNLLAVSSYLQSVEILNGDFEQACADCKEGDFVFFDSPYAPINPTSFESYTKEGFEKEDHERLSRLFRELDSRGCLCMLTNHNTELIRELYQGYSVDEVQVRRSINRNGNGRRGTELIIRNY